MSEARAYPVNRVLKADTQTIVTQVPYEMEDAFQNLYVGQNNAQASILQPPFNPFTLKQLAVRNNVLSQLIDAMEVNIDGTGWEIRLDPEAETETENEAEIKALKGFFKEPYPGTSFTTIRKDLRRDLEETGNAYLEVSRNVKGDIAFLRRLDATTMRLLKLDAQVQVTKTIRRNGEDSDITMWVRERRYAQMIGTQVFYHREFGSSRSVNRLTGEWVAQGEKIDPSQVGTEVIHFIINKDASTPYGLPRWINNTPSVLGSRKAEEFNLGFFDSGGIPPVIVFVQGGSLADDVSESLKNYLSGKASDKNKGVVVEAYSNSGSLDSAGSVQIKVERFGDVNTKDAMFQAYDKNCEEHLRVAFRLPPIFIGRTQDYNRATAEAAYQVAEAQVFQPERLEFDEIINTKLCRALGATSYEFRSLPLSVTNVEVQLKALEMVKDKVDGEDFVTAVNDISSLDLMYSKEAEDKAMEVKQRQNEMAGQNGNQGAPDQNQEDPTVTKSIKQFLIDTGCFIGGD